MIKNILFYLAMQMTILYSKNHESIEPKIIDIGFRCGPASFPNYSDKRFSTEKNYFNLINGLYINSKILKLVSLGVEFNNLYSVRKQDSIQILTNHRQFVLTFRYDLVKVLGIKNSGVSIGLAINKTLLNITNTNINQAINSGNASSHKYSSHKYTSSYGYSIPIYFYFPETFVKNYDIECQIGYHIPIGKSIIRNVTDINYGQFFFSFNFPIVKI